MPDMMVGLNRETLIGLAGQERVYSQPHTIVQTCTTTSVYERVYSHIAIIRPYLYSSDNHACIYHYPCCAIGIANGSNGLLVLWYQSNLC